MPAHAVDAAPATCSRARSRAQWGVREGGGERAGGGGGVELYGSTVSPYSTHDTPLGAALACQQRVLLPASL